MSAQPDHLPAPPPAPSPRAAAQLLIRIRAERPERSERWLSAFERDWAKALEDSRQTYDLSPLHEVVRTWRARLDSAPAVDAFVAGGMDDADGISLAELTGDRR
ncbi:DUF6247 family protein [Kitasatospora cathayae]|uniref:DUF6247 family protein n=1 Tax=Kitasatospora cathayae TaxID=3004092 RepID=A0ABY7QF68_9ACTN|nr:DUF6247 family protein [Kitasatospora sp. HUAS 3-15]WBP91373.1 DUF6247 family protein [Kitasatospora sp. HUAS 3-15]